MTVSPVLVRATDARSTRASARFSPWPAIVLPPRGEAQYLCFSGAWWESTELSLPWLACAIAEISCGISLKQKQKRCVVHFLVQRDSAMTNFRKWREAPGHMWTRLQNPQRPSTFRPRPHPEDGCHPLWAFQRTAARVGATCDCTLLPGSPPPRPAEGQAVSSGGVRHRGLAVCRFKRSCSARSSSSSGRSSPCCLSHARRAKPSS